MISKNINLLQIEYFLAVAQHLNFTEAAKSLYISQPSLSKQIALLEKELGIQLFLRTKRSVHLTSAGALLFKELGEITERIEKALEKSEQAIFGEFSSIVIGCLNGMDTDEFLPGIINSFKSRYPDTKLVFERHSWKTLREKLINGAIDVAFTLSFEVDDSLGILWSNISKTTPSIVMSSAHPLAKRNDITLSDLKNENFVVISRDESPRAFDSIINLCRKYGFTPKIVKQLPNVESMLLSVEYGLGITLIDSNVRLFNNDKFRIYNIEGDSANIVMAWKKDSNNPIVPFFTGNVLDDVKDMK